MTLRQMIKQCYATEAEIKAAEEAVFNKNMRISRGYHAMMFQELGRDTDAKFAKLRAYVEVLGIFDLVLSSLADSVLDTELQPEMEGLFQELLMEKRLLIKQPGEGGQDDRVNSQEKLFS